MEPDLPEENIGVLKRGIKGSNCSLCLLAVVNWPASGPEVETLEVEPGCPVDGPPVNRLLMMEYPLP